MAPATDQTAYTGNPFRRKATASQGLEYDTGNHPSSPSPSKPYPSGGLGLDTRTSFNEPRYEISFDYSGVPQPAIPRQPFTTFRSSLPANDSPGSGDASLQTRPKKIVKKVRVQSPPPSSPEDIVPVTRDESDEYSYDDDDNDDVHSDRLSGRSRRMSPFGAQESPTQVGPQLIPAAPPANPFSRTLQDIEPAVQDNDGASGIAGGSKGAMDVTSFKRLLLTGQSDVSAAPKDVDATTNSQSTAAVVAHDATNSTDVSSASMQSLVNQVRDRSRTSNPIAEPENSERPRPAVPTSRLAVSPRAGSSRPKPPPPSSRHGKLIKVELGAEGRATGAQAASEQDDSVVLQLQTADSDVNKPLPASPVRSSADKARESPFDQEAAGKTPEAFTETPRPPISPTASINRSRSESQGSTQSKRASAPPQAPPPRRHARSESKVVPSQPKHNDEDPPRSSLDSIRSRSESIRAGNGFGSLPSAPAPPPPRRPAHGRSGSTYSVTTQPDALGALVTSQRLGTPSLEERTSMDWASGSPQAGLSRESTPKVAAPPPPPPARNPSLRRPQNSRRGSEASTPSAVNRKSSGNRTSFIAPPPPPPPRQRGSSRGSMEISTRPVLKDLGSQSSMEASDSQPATSAPMDNHGIDILADLDALQREVDAMMQQAKG